MQVQHFAQIKMVKLAFEKLITCITQLEKWSLQYFSPWLIFNCDCCTDRKAELGKTTVVLQECTVALCVESMVHLIVLLTISHYSQGTCS